MADWQKQFGLVGKDVDDKLKMNNAVFFNKVQALQLWAGGDPEKWQRIANLDSSIPDELPNTD